MRRANKIRSFSLFFSLIVVSTIVSSIMVFGLPEPMFITENDDINNSNGTADEMKQQIVSEIDQLMDKVQNSSDICWREPISHRKEEINEILIEIKDLIIQDTFKEAYNKFLHEIKPKLTGLKTDENEKIWGDGVFKDPWILCNDLREEFRVDCNEILYNIKKMITFV